MNEKKEKVMAIKACFIVPHPPLIIPEIGRGDQLKVQRTSDAYHRVLHSAEEGRNSTGRKLPAGKI